MTEPESTATESHLSEAVEKTGGLQPWRRLFHATNGTLVVLALAVLGLSRPTALLILGIILGVLAIMDLIRLLDPKVNILFFRAFSSLASPREQKKVASSTWYAASVLLVLLLFPLDYALAGILVLAWADPAANVIGQKTGKHPFLAGTVRGTATFVVVAFCALVCFVPWWMALVAAALTGLVEAAPLELDDNLIVPLTAAGLLYFMGLLI